MIIFYLIHLRIRSSGAKFDAEPDFDIHLAIAASKHDEIAKNAILLPEIFTGKYFWATKIEMLGIVRNAF